MSESGTITKLIAGIGGLIVLVVITFVIVSTVLDADMFTRGTYTISVENGTVYLNSTGYQLTNYTVLGDDWTILGIFNATSGSAIESANWTFDSSNATLTNATAIAWNNVSINYSFTYKGSLEQAPFDLGLNMTSGTDNVSEKIPTILLIAAVVLLFGVLVVLILRSKTLGIGSGGGL